MRKLLIILGIVVAVAVVALVALPFLVNADSFRPRIEAELQQSLGRKVSIGKLSLSVLAGGVTADDIAIADDPAFSNKPFLHAKSLDVGVDLWPLIFSRTLHVRSLTLVEPQVALLHNSAGKWNFASLGPKTQKQPTSSQNFSVEKLRIVHGTVSVGAPGGKPDEYSDISLEASDISYTSPIPFVLEANTPGAGHLRLEGHAGPIDRADTSLTPMQASINVTGMQLARTGFLPPDSGVSGTLDYTGTASSDGGMLHSEGTAKAEQLKLVRAGAPASQPVSFAYTSDYDMKRQTGSLLHGEARTGNSAAQVTGNYDTRGPVTVVHMKLKGRDLPIQEVAGLLPALGVVLPAGSSLRGGSVTANLNLDGAVNRLVTTGDLNVSNVKLAGFNLGSKMAAIASLAGIHTGADTDIQSLSSKLRIGPEGIRADSLSVLVADVGTVTGAGTVANNNALNFRMNAKLSNPSLVGGLQRIAGIGQAPKNGIPFLIQGTTANPVFLPDVGGIVGQTVQAPAQGLGGILGGFFGRKKK